MSNSKTNPELVSGCSNFQIFKPKITLLFLLMLSTVSYAQKEGNIWYFGENAGLDFNSGIPVALTDGAINTHEGCSVISDANGNLLFYTDGVTVWNKNHKQMPNGFGLLGHSSSTQSALIVQIPDNDNLYYIFTTPAQAQTFISSAVFWYSIVDMNLDGGLGDVTDKNRFLYTPTTEKLTAVKHSNGCDIWVISHEWDSDRFFAFRVKASGLDTTPVISKIGAFHGGGTTNANAIGQLKASPDGNKLALSISFASIVELFDFDNTTGIISSLVSFPPIGTAFGNMQPYGIAFSPDGAKLYVSLGQRVYQYNLKAGSSTDIINSQMLIGSSPDSPLAALQLGPDGKIYCATVNRPDIGVINNPNALGMACNFIDKAVSLGGNFCKFGLPTFMESSFNSAFEFGNGKNCLGDTAFFTIRNSINIDSVHWDFDDPGSGVFNTSMDLNPYHLFSGPGVYNVQMTKYGSCESVFIKTVIINDTAPQVNLGNDTILCPGTLLSLQVDIPGATYLWQDGSSGNGFTVTSPGIYWLELTNPCGSAKDSVLVDYFPPVHLELGSDTVLCKGQSLLLDATVQVVSYRWQDDSDSATYNVTSGGVYWVEVTDTNSCVQSDSVFIYSIPNITAFTDLACLGDSARLGVSFTKEIPDNCRLTSTDCLGSIATGVLGMGTVANTVNSYPAPYGNSFWGARHQVLYLASEIQAMGFNGGKITAIALDVASMNSGKSNLTNFEIRMKCTDAVELSSWEEGMFTVFPAQSITVTTGWNNHYFSSAFEWDGISNIILEICFNNYTSSASNIATRYTQTGFNSVLYRARNSDVCHSGLPSVSSNRPNIRFNYCNGPLNPKDYTYHWFPNSTLSDSTVQDPMVLVNDSASYNVIVTSIYYGCSDTATVDVEPGNRSDASIFISGPFCEHDTAVILEAVDGGGLWSGPGIMEPVKGIFDPSVAGPGSHEIIYTISGNCGNEDTSRIIVHAVPDAAIITQGPFCSDDSPVYLSAASPGGVWSSSPGVNAIDPNTGLFDPSKATGNDTIIYFMNGPCPNADTIVVVVNQKLPGIDLGNDTLLCLGQSLVLKAPVSDARYRWQDGTIDSVYIVTSPGLYWVEITKVACSVSDSVSVEIKNVKADFGYEEIPCTNQIQFVNLSSDTLFTFWNFGDGATSNENHPVHTYRISEKYAVILISNPGSTCADTIQKLIPFENDAFTDTLFIPNVFTPNGDGKNDYFEIIGIDDPCVDISRLTIFNRWGMKVFETFGRQLRWDGTTNGNTLAEGIYYYILEGEEFKRSGSVILLK